MSKMTADEIAEAVAKLAETTRKATVKDILDELGSGWKQQEHEPDTWAAGFQAAIDIISSNF